MNIASTPLFWLLLCAAIAIAWAILYQRSDFAIRVDQHDVRINGRIAIAHRVKISDFCQRGLASARPWEVRGQFKTNGRLILRFKGAIDSGAQQQVRNFLHTLL